MKKNEKRLMVLMADDDPHDCLLAMEAIKNSFSDVELKSVRDGIELIEYLRCINSHSLLKAPPLPDLILLDLNMPKKNGFDVLQEISADRKLRRIPVIVMTTSENEEDIRRSYELGANTFVRKPSHFDGLVEVMNSILEYWSETACLSP